MIWFDLRTTIFGIYHSIQVVLGALCAKSAYIQLDDQLRISVLGDEKHATFSLISSPLYVNPVQQQSDMQEMENQNRAMSWMFFRGAIELTMESIPQLGLQLWIFFHKGTLVSERQLELAFLSSSFSIVWNGFKVYRFKRYGQFNWARLARFLWRQDTRWPLIGLYNNRVVELTIDKMGEREIKYFSNFCSLVSRATSLRILNILSSDIGDSGIESLTCSLKSNRNLEILDLQQNSIGDTGAHKLADCLRGYSSLTALDLSWNVIAPAGFLRIADILAGEETSLSVFNIAGNSLGTEGSGMMAWALRHNSTLLEVNFRRNDIGDSGAGKFGEAIAANGTLKRLDLRQNAIGDSGATKLEEHVRQSTVISSVDLRGNRVTPAVQKVLCNKIKLF